MHYCIFEGSLVDVDESNCQHARRHQDYNLGFSAGPGPWRDIQESPIEQATPREKLSLTIGRRVTDGEWRAWLLMAREECKVRS